MRSASRRELFDRTEPDKPGEPRPARASVYEQRRDVTAPQEGWVTVAEQDPTTGRLVVARAWESRVGDWVPLDQVLWEREF